MVVDDNAAIHRISVNIRGWQQERRRPWKARSLWLFRGRSFYRTGAGFEIDSAFQGKEGLAMVRKAVAEGRPYPLAFVTCASPGWDRHRDRRAHRALISRSPSLIAPPTDYSLDDMLKNLGPHRSARNFETPFEVIEVLAIGASFDRDGTLPRWPKPKVTVFNTSSRRAPWS